LKKKFGSNQSGQRQVFSADKQNQIEQSFISTNTSFDPHSKEAAWLNERLHLLVADARLVGIPENIVLSGAMNWAAHRTYDSGGYDGVKAALLDLFETILILAAKKPRAKF
jgi:hypothetical protein